MCYISTTADKTRDAVEGESLDIIRHWHGTNWLVSPADPETAVCLRDNTIVAVTYEEHPAQLIRKKVREEAIFRQKLEGASGNDFFCFIESGQNKSLHRFPRVGVRVEVLKVLVPAGSDQGTFDLRDVKENREPVPVRVRPNSSGAD